MVSPARTRRWPLVTAIIAVATAGAAVCVWDLDRQSLVAVQHLATSQAVLAEVLAKDPRVIAEPRAVFSLARMPETVVLVKWGNELHDAQALPVTLPSLLQLAAGPAATIVLSRAESEKLALPSRRSVAAWAPSGAQGGVLVVASAHVERDQAQREELVVVSTLALITVVAVALGAIALRREEDRLEAVHRLEREVLQHERDEQLARAERVAVASALSLGIAHELATPLSVISARVEQARRSTTDERAVGALEVVVAQVEQMKQIMHGFLALARGDQPVLALRDPEQVARHAAASVLHRFTDSKVVLELETQPKLPTIAVEETLMQAALANVLVNAAQASPAGSTVQLRVGLEQGAVVFSVLDRGAGLPAGLSSELTRPFVTTRAHAGGTGLGLAIATEIVRHHGGTLELASRPDGGASVRLVLPLTSERRA